MSPPKAKDKEKKIWVAASNQTVGFFRVSHYDEHINC